MAEFLIVQKKFGDVECLTVVCSDHASRLTHQLVIGPTPEQQAMAEIALNAARAAFEWGLLAAYACKSVQLEMDSSTLQMCAVVDEMKKHGSRYH